jgi:D-arabinose 1-dehydrogenase-like Zn-dependent alcohol dehydrogenase
MYFGTGSNVADLSLDKDGRIDCFKGFDRFFRLPHVLLEWQGGRKIESALTGTPGTGDATLKFSVLSGVTPMIETMPLERAPEAYAKMMAGNARFRMVLTMV